MEHKLILGGEEYLPFARSRVKALKATGLAYANQSYEVGGVSIKVRIEPGHEYIRIEGGVGYVESGVLDLHDVLKAAKDTYVPANLKLTTFVSGLMVGRNALLNAGTRKMADGDESWSAAGCKESKKQTTVTYFSSTGDERVIESSPASFCDPEVILKAKLLMESRPASLAPGKMKLFIQALYGSRRTKYRLPSVIAEYIELSTEEFTVPPEGSTAPPREIFVALLSGLMTVVHPVTKHKSYLLVYIGRSGVTYRRMTPKGAAPSRYRGPRTDLDEVFVLSTLVPEVKVSDAVGPDLTPIFAGFEGVAHGWQFNLTGDTAAAVMKKGATISGVKYLTLEPSTIGGYEFVQFVFSFQWDFTAEVLNYTIERRAEGRHIPYLQAKIFVPGLSTQTMNMLVPTSDLPWDCYADLTAPVYCYFVGNDLVTVTASNSKPVIVEATPSATTMEEFTGTKFVGAGSWTYRTSPRSVETSCSISVGGSVYSGGAKSYFGTRFVTTIVFSGPSAGSVYMDSGPASYRITSREDDSTERTTPILIIPFGDCSAVIAGTERYSVGTLSLSERQGFGNNIYPTALPPLPPEAMLWATFTMLWDQPEPEEPPEEQAGQITSSATLHAGATAQTIFSSSLPFSAFYSRPYAGLFGATGVDAPYYDFPMTVRTSYSGAMQRLFCEPVIDPAKPWVSSSGWPDARWTAAVGWA